jgi:UDP-glucose 4-epimerase
MVLSQSFFFGKKVLVTGASGFIGTHLCRSLYAEAAEVHGISRNLPMAESNLVHWWQGYLEDISSVRAVMHKVKPDIVYHLASYVTGSRAIEHVLPTLHSNFISTINLLMASTEIGCQRIVLAGSLEEPDLDQDLITPSSPYAAAKWASSNYARMFHDLYQAPVVTAKIFMVYGPAQNRRFLIPYVISSLLEGVSPQVSSGTRSVDWIYVDDVVSGLLAMAHAPNIDGCTIDLGSGTLTTVRAVVEQLVSCANDQVYPEFGAIPDRPREQIRVANTANAYTRLGWQSITALEAGLKLTVDWYKNQLIATSMKPN